MREVTRERLKEIVSDPMLNQGSEFAMMARMALAAMDSESADEVYAELYRLREEVKGPYGFDTWRDAAIAEKKARVELERQTNQSGRDIDYLGAMAAFHSNEWHKMDPITGYMYGWNARGNHAQPAPVVPDNSDPRDAFEEVFSMPTHVERCGTGYAVTAYGAWNAYDFVKKWEGWNAYRAAMLNQK